MTVGTNIRKARENLKLSQAELAKKLSVSDKTISSWEKERSTPSEEMIHKLMKILDVDPNFLFGWDDRVQDGFSLDEKGMIKKSRQLKKWEKEMIVRIMDELIDNREREDMESNLMSPYPLGAMPYGLGISAGYGNIAPDDIETIRIRMTPKAKKATFVLKVDGHSMEPEYENGDLVLVKAMDDIEYGDVGAYWVDGDVYIKQKAMGALHSLNPDYPDVPLDTFSEIKCFGKVIGKAEI